MKKRDLTTQPLDIFYDGTHKLGPVLRVLNSGSTDLMDRLVTTTFTLRTSASYLRADKKGVELGKHPKRLVGVHHRSQSIPETGDDLVLHPSYALVVCVLGGDPNLG